MRLRGFRALPQQGGQVITFSEVWGFIAPFISVGAFGALFLVYGTTKTLRDTNNDLRAQHEDDKARIVERDETILKMQKSQAEMQGRIGVLESLVTGAVNWTAISDLLETHHREAVGHWKSAIDTWEKDEELLAEILVELKRGNT